MTFYEELVMQTQMNFSKYYGMYASGKTPYILTEKKPLPYPEQISRLVRELKEADCIVVGGASGLSAAGAEIFIMKIMTLIGSILESLQKNMASRANLRECSIHFRQEKSTGDMWRLS